MDIVNLVKLYNQHLLLQLPCTVGTTIYKVVADCEFGADCYTKMKCNDCEYLDIHIEPETFHIHMLGDNGQLPKNYFLSEEKAKEVESSLKIK